MLLKKSFHHHLNHHHVVQRKKFGGRRKSGGDAAAEDRVGIFYKFYFLSKHIIYRVIFSLVTPNFSTKKKTAICDEYNIAFTKHALYFLFFYRAS